MFLCTFISLVSYTNYRYEVTVNEVNEPFAGLTFSGDDKNLIIWGAQKDNVILKRIGEENQEFLFVARTENKLISFGIDILEGTFATLPNSLIFRLMDR